MAQQYDAIIIGAGQAGFPLAGEMANQGWKTALIEADKLGGTCVNTGCTPTKTLIASARAAHMARRGLDFGVHTGAIEVDLEKVRERVRSVSATSREGLEAWLENLANLDVIYGRGVFTGPKTVRVNGEELSAAKIFINTGTRSNIPPIPGLSDVSFMTNEGLLELANVPEHLIVIGGSFLGLEFVQAFRRLGAQVTVLELAPRLIPRESPDVSAAVQAIVENEGVTVYTGIADTALEQRGDYVVARFKLNEETQEVIGTHLLLATGRQPNSDDMGLEEAGIETDKKGHITVDDRLETNVEGVYALGDVNGEGAFTHTSYNDYEVMSNILFGDDTRRVSDRIMTYAMYIDPPLARVGMTQAQAQEAGHQILVAKNPMSQSARAYEKSETQGFMKFIVDADTKRFLGAVILGTEGDELIASITNIMYADAPYTVVQNAMHIHPTVAELIPSTLAKLAPVEEKAAG
jgi:pyruvate/2-oxoglutarate dehydrogenase complex dihydrolipoamide dehydrogenase (E3) component